MLLILLGGLLLLLVIFWASLGDGADGGGMSGVNGGVVTAVNGAVGLRDGARVGESEGLLGLLTHLGTSHDEMKSYLGYVYLSLVFFP